MDAQSSKKTKKIKINFRYSNEVSRTLSPSKFGLAQYIHLHGEHIEWLRLCIHLYRNTYIQYIHNVTHRTLEDQHTFRPLFDKKQQQQQRTHAHIKIYPRTHRNETKITKNNHNCIF